MSCVFNNKDLYIVRIEEAIYRLIDRKRSLDTTQSVENRRFQGPLIESNYRMKIGPVRATTWQNLRLIFQLVHNPVTYKTA